jgi:caffeoyl-CoA O-methyltransferase
MDFIDKSIEEYAASHSTPENEVLKQLNRETNMKVLMPRMLSGHIQGRLLSMFSHMVKPKRILEIGTYTGYSGICLCEGLSADGLLYTIDINEELENMVRGYFEKAGLDKKIKYMPGNALDIIPGLNETFDLVFIDADKINYSRYYDMVFEKVRPGGFIIADNVLWSGRILEKQEDMDKDTLAIDQFNKKVADDKRVEKLLVPVRDGLMIVRKV